MTETKQTPRPRHSWRPGSRAALICLLAAALGVACWTWFRPARVAVPIPSEEVWKHDEPAVRGALDTARARVLGNPSSGAAWGLLGQVLLAHAYNKEATLCFREAQRLDPANPRWPYLLSRLLRASDSKAALVLMRGAVEFLRVQRSENSAPPLLLAEMLLTEDELDEAEDHFRRVLTFQPTNVRARYGLGLLMYRRGDLAESRSLLLSCADNPYTARKACTQLAVICQRLGDQKAAETFDRKAKTPGEDYDWRDPFAEEARALAVSKRSRFEQAETLEQQGRFEEAVHLYRQIVHDSPDRLALLALGMSLSKIGDWANAEEMLREGLAQATPNNPDSYQVNGCYLLSFVLFKKGERLLESGDAEAKPVLAESVAWARKALAYKPDHALARMFLGLSLRKLGRRREALAALRQAVVCAPGLTDAHLHLGDALAEEGLDAEAEAAFRAAARLASADDRRPAAALARLQRAKKKGDSQDKPPSSTRDRRPP